MLGCPSHEFGGPPISEYNVFLHTFSPWSVFLQIGGLERCNRLSQVEQNVEKRGSLTRADSDF